jgi:pSer/pThr/pTyr-binding forkhead associated (FHA) protein
MSELTLTVLQLGLLVLLWLFVLGVVGVLRGDLFGTRITSPTARRPARDPRRDPAADLRRDQPRDRPAAPSPAPPTGARKLVVVEGSLRGTTITLGTAPITLGRSPECTLVLDDDYASGHHARLVPSPSGWVVEDLGSTNGTFLGKDRVVSPRPVPARTPVRIGRTVLELRS